MAASERVVPLLVYKASPLTADEAERIKAAKRALNLPYLMQMARATPESDGRVLAIGGPPDFPCDYIRVADATLTRELESAVEWCLGEREQWVGTVDIIEMLESALGGPVREVTDAEDNGRLGIPVGEREQRHVLPEHDERCEHYGTTVGCGSRGCTDPNAGGRDAEREIREADRAQS